VKPKPVIERSLLFAFVLLMMVGLFTPHSYGEEKNIKWGISFSVGIGEAIHNEPDLTKYAILPRLDIPLHRNWDLEIEGNYSYWALARERDLYFIGANANFLFKPIQWNKGALFLLVGGGLGYDNNGDRAKHGRVKQIGDSHFAGIAQAGTGIFYKIGNRWELRGEYRFNHISEPFRRDRGLNSHDFILGVSF
jgi:hypothetical protein